MWPDLPWWTTIPSPAGVGPGLLRVPQHVPHDTHDRAPGVPGLTPEALEGLLLADPVALHQEALGALDPCPAVEGADEVAELAVALDRDVDAARQLGRVGGVEMREDPVPRRGGE